MSIDDLFRGRETQGDDRPAFVLAGTLLDTAAALTDLVRVRLDDDPRQYVGPMTFTPGAVMPAAGERCLVAFSDRGEPWVVAWATDTALPPSGGGSPTGPAGGVLSGTYPNPGFAADMATQAELDAVAADLAGDVAAEAGARAAADTTEATIRAAADTALDGRLDTIEADFLTSVEGDAAYQPKDSDLTAIAALATTAFGRALLTQADGAAVRAAISAAAASHTHAQADITNLVSDLAAKQPLDSDLTAIAALSTTSFGRGLLALADAAAARTAIGTDATGAQRPPSGPETGLKIIRGTVNTAGSGTIVSGSGFTITRNSTGNLTVTFSTAFSSAPSGGLGTNADSVSYVTLPSTTSFRVLLRNESAGALAVVDAQFTFEMVGPA